MYVNEKMLTYAYIYMYTHTHTHTHIYNIHRERNTYMNTRIPLTALTLTPFIQLTNML